MKNCVIIFLVQFLYIGCSLFDVWNPKGEVSVSGYKIFDTDIRNCIIFYQINNKGSVKIMKSNASFKIHTDMGDYYKSITDNTSILPDGKIFGNFLFVLVSFRETNLITNISLTNVITNKENISGSGDISVENSFFE